MDKDNQLRSVVRQCWSAGLIVVYLFMSAAFLSDDVPRFIRDNIHSVEQLEVLLLLRSDRQKSWNAVEVSQRLFTVATSAAMRLADLQGRGLIQVTDTTTPTCYRYVPPSTDVDRIIADLDRAYRERKTTVIELIFTRSPDNIQVFADAFRLRRKE